MHVRTYDTGSPPNPNYATRRLLVGLRDDIALLAAHDSTRLAAGLIDLPAEYGNASLERPTLAPWVSVALLVKAGLKRRQRLKSWTGAEQ